MHTVHFDNSFSYFRAKRLRFRLALIPEAQWAGEERGAQRLRLEAEASRHRQLTKASAEAAARDEATLASLRKQVCARAPRAGHVASSAGWRRGAAPAARGGLNSCARSGGQAAKVERSLARSQREKEEHEARWQEVKEQLKQLQDGEETLTSLSAADAAAGGGAVAAHGVEP